MADRSRVERLPPRALAAVHAAIRAGDTIDEITRRMRAHGGTCSRAAVGRYVKQNRDALRRQSEHDDPGEPRQALRGAQPEEASAERALETLRSLVTRAADAIKRGEKPSGLQAIGALALAIGRIENAGKAGAAQQKARDGAGKDAGRAGMLPGWPRSAEEQKKGLSPDAVAHIRAAVEGYWGFEDPAACEEAVAEAYYRLKAPDGEGE